MARIFEKQAVWKVTLVEYERGYGQRIIWTEYYDNEDEAKARAAAVSDFFNPEDYYRAEVYKC